MEADAHFNAGLVEDIDKVDAIEAFNQALALEPGNPLAWAELARLQTYSSSLLPTQKEKMARMMEAQSSIQRAHELSPDDSTVKIGRAHV